MPEARTLRFLLRTPHAVVVDAAVKSVRVPTSSGLVGLRPRGEPMVAVIEPGLIVLRGGAGDASYAASAGGLLVTDRAQCELLTPFAVAGAQDAVLAALDAALETPDSELSARRKLGDLEARILDELRGGGGDRARPHVVSAPPAPPAPKPPPTAPRGGRRDG